MAEIAVEGVPTSVKPVTLRTVVAASAAGTAFEWYDFFVFGSLTAVIQKTFFSGLPETAGIAAALALFGAGFLFRPIGALVFGRIGDWSAGDIADFLKSGTDKCFNEPTGMKDVVASTSKLSDADLAALGDYIHALPAIAGAPKHKTC